MSRAPSLDNRPWYRNRWPWILMAGPAVVVVAGIVTAWIAATTSDGLVADDYYKQGLAVNQVLARNDVAAAMQLEARLRLVAGRIELRLMSRAGAALPGRVKVTVNHHSAATAITMAPTALAWRCSSRLKPKPTATQVR